jgi:predicted enzyme related to lactoylglutathione lyase
MQGQFVWYDLMTTDPEAAKRFYSPLGGWSTMPFEKSDPQNPYTMWTHNGEPIGGVARLTGEQRARGIPPHWMPSVEVNNVDSSLRQAQSLGGKVVMGPMDVPDTGRYAIIQDPQGAMLAIFTPQGGPMSSAFEGTPRVGRISWHELMTTDYKKAFDFYRQLLGWEKNSEMDMGGGMMYFMFGQRGKMYGGMFNRTADMANVPPFWLPYIFVRDLQKSMESATRAGAQVVNGPMDVPGGRIVVLKDPQGAAIALHQEVATPAARTPAATHRPKAASRPRAKKASTSKPKARAKAKSKRPAKRATRKAKTATRKASSRKTTSRKKTSRRKRR